LGKVVINGQPINNFGSASFGDHEREGEKDSIEEVLVGDGYLW